MEGRNEFERAAIIEAKATARRNQTSIDVRNDSRRHYYTADLRAPLHPGHVHCATVHCDGRVELVR